MKYYSLQAGYALLTSIILTATLALIAYAVANITLRQLAITTTNVESHNAFYTADSGLECALFWDVKNPNNTSYSAFDPNIAQASITCGGSAVLPTRVTSGSNVISSFQVPVGSSCAIVYVTKGAGNATTIESRGYNTCGSGSRFERAIRITY